jgi:Zinc knuckle
LYHWSSVQDIEQLQPQKGQQPLWKQQYLVCPTPFWRGRCRLNQAAAHVTCHNCKKKGHYAINCPTTAVERKQTIAAVIAANTKDKKGSSNVGCELSFLNYDGIVMPRSWILLDNQSTADVFCNASLLSNIREGLGSMTIHCNAGTVKTTTIGNLPSYDPVWYHSSGIANILSLSLVISKGLVTYGYGIFQNSKSQTELRWFLNSPNKVSFTLTLRTKDQCSLTR